MADFEKKVDNGRDSAGIHRRLPELVIFQDGVERVRLKVLKGERLPQADEDLFAIVDLQGSVRSVELIEGAAPPPGAGWTP